MVNGQMVETKSNSLLAKVYGWMAFGLTLTGIIAYYVSSTPKIYEAIFRSTGLVIGLVVLQILLVLALSFFLNRMSAFTASILFIAYSCLNGVVLATVFLVYTESSIALTFLISAGMFAAMALYGYFTKADLSGMGNFLFMALIGLIISLVVNIFLKSSAFDYVISAFGVIIFALLTAYDMQQIKNISRSMIADGETIDKVSVICALKLYLDLINLFLYLLTFFGKRKE